MDGMAGPDHDFGEVCAIRGHRAVCHQMPEWVGLNRGANDVFAEDSECRHVLRGGTAGLVNLRSMQGADTNSMPVDDKRVAVDRDAFTLQ
jgi:hypothetical protein